MGEAVGWTLVGGKVSDADLYVGYSRAVTGDTWFKDGLRVELRVRY